MKKIIIFCLFVFCCSNWGCKKYKYEIYQGGKKIDTKCFDWVDKGRLNLHSSIYVINTNEICK